MNKFRWVRISLATLLLIALCGNVSWALGERGKTVTYKITYHTAAGELSTYAHYSIVAHEDEGYWLQRVATMRQDSGPLSITQILLDDYTHEALRYIMHRPAKMNQPASVVDLPFSEMGQDEIMPTPVTGAFTQEERLALNAGTFDTKKGWDGKATLWLSLEIPVVGIARAETDAWTMELLQIRDHAEDLLVKKPSKGGSVPLNENGM